MNILITGAGGLIDICNTLTPQYYNDRIDIINENFNRVNTYQNYETRISEKIIGVLKYNNFID